MDNISRLRQVPARVLKVQRRIWLLQATFWSVITLGCIVVMTAVARSIWRRDATAVANDGTGGTPDRATGQAALNSRDVPAAAELRQS